MLSIVEKTTRKTVKWIVVLFQQGFLIDDISALLLLLLPQLLLLILLQPLLLLLLLLLLLFDVFVIGFAFVVSKALADNVDEALLLQLILLSSLIFILLVITASGNGLVDVFAFVGGTLVFRFCIIEGILKQTKFNEFYYPSIICQCLYIFENLVW